MARLLVVASLVAVFVSAILAYSPLFRFVDSFPVPYVPRVVFFGYVAPLAFLAPLWIRSRLLAPPARPPALTVDVVVLVLSVARVTGPVVPFSGHMLFLVYTGLTTSRSWYRALVALIAAETTVFKFGELMWDPHGWWTGVVAGAAAALLHRWFGARFNGERAANRPSAAA